MAIQGFCCNNREPVGHGGGILARSVAAPPAKVVDRQPQAGVPARRLDDRGIDTAIIHQADGLLSRRGMQLNVSAQT